MVVAINNNKPRVVVLIVVFIIFVWKAADHHALTLPILFQNEHMAVVSKPPLVPCHVPLFRDKTKSNKRRISSKDRKQHDDTVHKRAIETFFDKENIYLVHRLDAPTSGCLLLAFHPDAARELGKALSNSNNTSNSTMANNATTTKTYYALCRGDGEALRQRGETFVVDGDIKDANGILRSAKTELQGLWGSPSLPRRCCLVRARPSTGRWHQIRQHLARENYPIVGETKHHPDRKENKAWKEILTSQNITQRLCLHCYRIQIPPARHPGLDDAPYHQFLPPNGLDISCPLPDDMRNIIDMTDWAKEARDALPELFGGHQQPHPTTVG